uniref:Uncharacterized protein n=1 Tax=Pyramimonas obovata TaxID=1411642 RepID=A0A7S0N6M6_9CHLO|mmetsp:Transcript_22008/g.48295  ORF Transcript_22008/g.48295 Transcript_22008/m.48295 type:complete len:225 (+) Transcript_22008:1-675(+)
MRKVLALTPEGWADPTPAVAAVTLDNTAPVTTLACPVGPQPPNVRVYGTVTDLLVDPMGTQYKLGDAGYSPPGNPIVPCLGCPDNTFLIQLNDLVEGQYTLTVRSTDAAHLIGNEAVCEFVVDVGAPDTFFKAHPPRKAAGAGPSRFVFGCDELACTYGYVLDGGAIQQVMEDELALDGLAVGLHTLKVFAMDSAGNMDLTPAVYTWSVVAEGDGSCASLPTMP